jgi:hypothetical protein
MISFLLFFLKRDGLVSIGSAEQGICNGSATHSRVHVKINESKEMNGAVDKEIT